jgi:hypothetical protein
MVVTIFKGHAAVRRHLYIIGLFDGDPACRFCGMETETVQRITCCCETLIDLINIQINLIDLINMQIRLDGIVNIHIRVD